MPHDVQRAHKPYQLLGDGLRAVGIERASTQAALHIIDVLLLLGPLHVDLLVGLLRSSSKRLLLLELRCSAPVYVVSEQAKCKNDNFLPTTVLVAQRGCEPHLVRA